MDVLLTTEAILMVLNASTETVVQVPPRRTLLPTMDDLAEEEQLLGKYDRMADELNNITQQGASDRTRFDLLEDPAGTEPSTKQRWNITSNRSYPEKVPQVRTPTNTTATITTTVPPPPPPSTRKHIYVRGHLLTRKRERGFHPADTQSRGKDAKTLENVHRTFVQDFRNEPGHQKRIAPDMESGSKRKKKHSEKKEKFYNYKMLYDTIKVLCPNSCSCTLWLNDM